MTNTVVSMHTMHIHIYLYTTNLKEYNKQLLWTKQQTALLEAIFETKEPTMHEVHTVNYTGPMSCLEMHTNIDRIINSSQLREKLGLSTTV